MSLFGDFGALMASPSGSGGFPALASPTSANAKLLLHFDGADGATTTVDSALGQTGVFNNQAQLDTAEKVFGTASLLLDGAGDDVVYTTEANFDIGASQFSMFAWIRPTTVSGIHSIMSKGWGNNRSYILYQNGADLSCEWSSAGGASGNTGSMSSVGGVFTAGVWHLVGWTRASDNTQRLFCAPTGEASVPVVASVVDADTFFNAASNFRIGRIEGGSFSYGGHIDELLFTMECLATAEFAMPAAPFSIV